MKRSEVMTWHADWSFADKATISEELDRLDATTFLTIPKDGYIKVFNPDGVEVMRINRGYLKFMPGFGPRHAQLGEPRNPNTDSYLPFTCHRLRTTDAYPQPTLVGQARP